MLDLGPGSATYSVDLDKLFEPQFIHLENGSDDINSEPHRAFGRIKYGTTYKMCSHSVHHNLLSRSPPPHSLVELNGWD